MFAKFAKSLALSGVLVSLAAASAYPAAKITNVAVKHSDSGVSVDLSFDKPMSAKGIKPAFERNFVQLVFKSTKVDAARIVQVADSQIEKVFAYPYSADTARVRLILKQNNDWAKGRVSLWNNNAKTIRVFIKEAAAAKTAADAKRQEPSVAKTTLSAVQKTDSESASVPQNSEDSKILKDVMTNTREIDIHNPESVKAALAATTPTVINEDPAEQKQVGVKSDPSRHFARMAIALFGILAVFLGGAWLFRRYAVNLKRLPFGKKERLIQVVATHYLGNKKSISLVKITGEYMVVGVSNEGIHLISKLGPEINVEKYLEDRFWGGTFEKHLNTYSKDPKVTKAIDLGEDEVARVEAPKAQPKLTASYDGPRDVIEREVEDEEIQSRAESEAPAVAVASQIADKVELSPVRASIKEKLTKLKPLQ